MSGKRRPWTDVERRTPSYTHTPWRYRLRNRREYGRGDDGRADA